MAATRKRHARDVARSFAAETLRQTEICWWASNSTDLTEGEIDIAQDELKRIACRIEAQRAQAQKEQSNG